ncbi:DUF3500 domain-containing protein [Streptomyces asoensis]|uniref:DUF3500 domain-containing protein n=1 Tax=Streptomyces asoensis TaxID=249586 RepID=UPI0037A0490A
MHGHRPRTPATGRDRRWFMNRALLAGGVAAITAMTGCSAGSSGTAGAAPGYNGPGGMPSGGPGGEAGGMGPGASEVAYQDFVGVTTDGTVADGLYAIHSTDVSTDQVVQAAQAFLDGLTGTDALLGAALSAEGLTRTRNIMKLNAFLGDYAGGGRDTLTEGAYFFTFMGTPSTTRPWGFQYEGHHVAINYFVLGDQVVMTPTFMGSEPTSATYEGEKITVFSCRAPARTT